MLIMDPNNLFFGLALASRRFIMSLNFRSFSLLNTNRNSETSSNAGMKLNIVVVVFFCFEIKCFCDVFKCKIEAYRALNKFVFVK